MNIKFYAFFALFSLFFAFIQSLRVKDNIYVKLYDSNFACFRILNGTHQTGCQSNQFGSHGVVHVIGSDDDVTYVVNDSGGHFPFIIAMRMPQFSNMSLLNQLHNSRKVSGILLFHELNSVVSKSSSYSEDSSCPNNVNDMYKDTKYATQCTKNPWNQNGTGMRFMDWDIPIFLLQNETEINFIENECYKKFNQPSITGQAHDWPLCALEMTMFNIAAGSSVTCLRRNELWSGLEGSSKTCDIMEDENIYAFIPKTNKSNPLPEKSVVVLAARMDSFSLFSQHDLGAISALGNVITLLTVAKSIGELKNESYVKSAQRHLMLALFNGESLDYIGSSRMAWDMSRDKFPDELKEGVVNQSALLNFSQIDFFLELNQLIDTDRYYLHVDPMSTKDVKDKVRKNCATLAEISKNQIDPNIDSGRPLPPASLQSFLKIEKKLAGAVLTNHKQAYTNRFYNSFLDSQVQFNKKEAVNAVVRLADTLVKFVANVTWQVNLTDSRVDRDFVEQLAECFWNIPSWNCTALERITDSIINKDVSKEMKRALNDVPLQRTYASVKFSRVRFFTVYMMSYLLGDRQDLSNESADACGSGKKDDIHGYVYMKDIFNNSSNASYCVISTVKTSVAKSPAFEIQDYDMTSGQYSTWTESVWQNPQMRMFMKPNPTWEKGVFSVGVIILIVSFVVCYFLNKGSDALFASGVVAL